MEPKILLTFSDDEKRVVRRAYQQFQHTVAVIAEVHDLPSPYQINDDASGIVGPPDKPAEEKPHADK